MEWNHSELFITREAIIRQIKYSEYVSSVLLSKSDLLTVLATHVTVQVELLHKVGLTQIIL